MQITAKVQRGKYVGTILRPHRHTDGTYVISKTRLEKDYIRVSTLEEVVEGIKRGLKVRMSNPDAGVTAASLISPENIIISSSQLEATRTVNTGTTIQIPLENPSWLERKKYEIPSTYSEIFPRDALGARGQADMECFPARGKEVVFDYGVVTSTCDIATRRSGAMRPRDNSGMRTFLEANKASIGDIITVTRTAERSYKVSLVKR